MRHFLIYISLISSITLTSCFKDEPLNAECDITEASVHTDDPGAMFFNMSDTTVKVLYTENNVTFKVRKECDRTALAPRFVTTEGATMEPANGSTHDFSNGPVIYKVTSQDGKWSRSYAVSFNIMTRTVNYTVRYDFETFKLNDATTLSGKEKYYVWSDVDEKGTWLNNWASGNEGYSLTMGSATADEYPTCPYKDGYDGYGVKLTTCSTGPLGQMVNKRLAAGNLFIGKFNGSSALLDAMKATQFGIPFDLKPEKLTGYYRYKAGATFMDENGKTVAGRTDKGTIYAVLYRNHDDEGNAITLYGDNVQTSDAVVAMAKVKDVDDTDGWTFFEIPFTYSEDIDQTTLDNYGYSLAVVCSSSIDGAYFRGAVGSTLIIDKIRIICEKTE